MASTRAEKRRSWVFLEHSIPRKEQISSSFRRKPESILIFIREIKIKMDPGLRRGDDIWI